MNFRMMAIGAMVYTWGAVILNEANRGTFLVTGTLIVLALFYDRD